MAHSTMFRRTSLVDGGAAKYAAGLPGERCACAYPYPNPRRPALCASARAGGDQCCVPPRDLLRGLANEEVQDRIGRQVAVRRQKATGESGGVPECASRSCSERVGEGAGASACWLPRGEGEVEEADARIVSVGTELPMPKPRPPIAKHTNQTGISSPSLPPPDRGKHWKTTGTGSGSRPVRSRAQTETSAPKDQRRGYKGKSLGDL
jgi:hypothetical protein